MSDEPQTVQLELLLNRAVLDREGRVLGRIEEVVAEDENGDLYVKEYHTGGLGLLEHLTTITVGSWFMRLLGRHKGHVIRWDQLDLSDPQRPRITCGREELGRRSTLHFG